MPLVRVVVLLAHWKGYMGMLEVNMLAWLVAGLLWSKERISSSRTSIQFLFMNVKFTTKCLQPLPLLRKHPFLFVTHKKDNVICSIKIPLLIANA